MKTECTSHQLEFQGLGRRRIVGAFDGGHISSDGGVLLLRELDARLGITQKLAECFTDHRDPDRIEHSVLELVRQRVYGIALGYEDLNDHDDLKWDPLLALALGKKDIEGKRRHREADCGKLLASSSTLNRLELTPRRSRGTLVTKRLFTIGTNSKPFLSRCFSIRLQMLPTKSCWILTRRTTRCTTSSRASIIKATTGTTAPFHGT